MVKSQHPDLGTIELTTLLAALADPVRLGLVRLLSDGNERQWGDLDAPVSKSTLSHHLKVLRDAGITRTRTEGARCFVRLRADELEQRFPGVLSSVVRARGHGAAEIGLKHP